MTSAGRVFARLGELGIDNRYARHALCKLISEHRTTNVHKLEPHERQDLVDLLDEVKEAIDGPEAF